MSNEEQNLGGFQTPPWSFLPDSLGQYYKGLAIIKQETNKPVYKKLLALEIKCKKVNYEKKLDGLYKGLKSHVKELPHNLWDILVLDPMRNDGLPNDKIIFKDGRVFDFWLPKNEEETETFNRFQMEVLKKTNEYPMLNIEAYIKKFNNDRKNSKRMVALLKYHIVHIDSIFERIRKKNSYDIMDIWYERSYIYGKPIDYKKRSFKDLVQMERGKAYALFKQFLEDELERETSKGTLSETENLDVPSLEKISHRIVLYNKLGLIEMLKKNHFSGSKYSQINFTKLIALTMGINDRREINTLRKSISTIGTRSKRNPETERAKNKVDAALTELGVFPK